MWVRNPGKAEISAGQMQAYPGGGCRHPICCRRAGDPLWGDDVHKADWSGGLPHLEHCLLRWRGRADVTFGWVANQAVKRLPSIGYPSPESRIVEVSRRMQVFCGAIDPIERYR